MPNQSDNVSPEKACELLYSLIESTISDNKNLHAQLKEAESLNRLKTEFISTISHELRTPLHAIIGFSEILLKEKDNEYMQDIKTCAKQLLNLADQILDIVKIESGKINVVAENFSLSDLVMEIRESFKPVILKKHIAFTVEISPLIELLYTDKSLLTQIIQNYLSNAFKFTPDYGKVALKIYPLDNHNFQIDVQDWGVGIDEINLKEIFSAFHPIDENNKAEYAGAGLGLSITKRFANALGGEVKVSSTKLKGSIFSVILPMNIPHTPLDETRKTQG